jgi:molybdopterin/thiamine biosynthesis adenylyltransferase
MSTKSHYTRRIVSPKIVSPDARFSVTDRQEQIEGFNQLALSQAKGMLIGAGGINSETGEGLCRKGVGELVFIDPDEVDHTNLNRQFFIGRDLFKKKAWRLIRNLAPHAPSGTALVGHALRFQDAVALRFDLRATFAVVGVDNGETRVAASVFFRKLGVPVIFIAVNWQAEAGYVFVQESGKACFGCLFPKTLYGRRAPCRTPASKDILKVVAGIALYAVDTLIMERKRNWNYREVHLAGFAPSCGRVVERRSDCPLCGDLKSGCEATESDHE